MSSKTVMRVVLVLVAVGLVAVEFRRDPDTASATSCLTIGPVAVVLGEDASANRRHRLFVTPFEVADGTEVTYEMPGADVDHAHTVTLSAAHFERLRNGEDVSVVSTTSGPEPGHAHTALIACP